MPAPPSIHDLVARFDAHRDAYRSGPYNETQARREFIDPFFEALGWDVNNRQGYAEAYKDVIHEDAIKIGGATKAPDYCFRVGGTRKFFVEAKKPSVKLRDDVSAAFQLRRYAWSARLPLSILSDFDEFAVYDCRSRPDKGDKPAAGRVLMLDYGDYLPRWDEIAGIFSRDAILRGGFDKYAGAAAGKHGTAEVDAAFLAEIEGWRESLARVIALRNPALSQRALNTAVQATIDRIVFLRICEDRGIESYGALLALANGGDLYPRLADLFRQADSRYNSGLFHFATEADRPESPDEWTLGLAIDDKPLRDILRSLYYPDSPYEFSVLPADILGQVYEQFLGQVIRLTPGHRAVVEAKPEVKKAGGVFYTPTYIVDTIVRHAVGPLLAGKTPRDVGAAPDRRPHDGRPQGSPLRIADIACGSGSFLLGAYQYLLDWYRDRYVEQIGATVNQRQDASPNGRPPQFTNLPIYQSTNGEWRLTTAERKRILLAHIYGVDIDPQAVEVTKLSLLLKVLEGENEQTLGAQLRLFQERALPDLGRNIKCGNSLIGPEFYEGQQLGLLDDDERYRINAFDWGAEFGGDGGRKTKDERAGAPLSSSVGGRSSGFGFDAIIGNPPYGAFLSEAEMAFLSSNFALQEYQLDTYLLFIEKGIRLLRAGGFLGVIIPNTWLLNLQSARIRRFIFSQTQIEEIVHYRYPVFSKAVVDTEVVVLRNAPASEMHQPAITIVERDGRMATYPLSQRRWQAGDGRPINIFERPEWTALADKLRALPVLDTMYTITQGAKPFQVGKGKPPQTRKIVDEKPYVAQTRQDPSFVPLLRGSMIQRYQTLWKGDYWISFGDWLAEPRYSASYGAPLKIVIRQTGDSLVATLDREQFIVRDNLYTIVSRQGETDLRYVLGLVNSRLLNWFYQTAINPERGEALAQVKRGHLAQLPIRPINFADATDRAQHDRMVALVETMLSLHRELAAAVTGQEKVVLQRQIETTDRQIDRLVYELYGLTAEEVEIVETHEAG